MPGGDFRRFRDETLAATWYGRAFIRCYYAVSPALVRLFGGQRWFRAIWKPRLDGMVRRLNGQGVADTPLSGPALVRTVSPKRIRGCQKRMAA